MWIVKLALRRPYTFVVVALLILIAGPLVTVQTPKDIFPNINIPVVSVIWTYTGLAPEDIAAQRSLQLSINRYTGGVTTYLEVTTAQAAALTDERTQVEILGRRMTDTVLLIKALGGGWDTSQLPDIHQIDRATVSQAQPSQVVNNSTTDGSGQ